MRPVIDPELLLENFNATFVRGIVVHILQESHVLEFKEFGKDAPYQFRQAIASLANSDGGFVIGGVSDPKNSTHPNSLEERVKGIPAGHSEFGTWLDTVLADHLLMPGVVIEQKEIKLDNKRVGIIKVVSSKIGPVGVKKEANGHLEFYRRGEQSKIRMSYADIRNAFNISTREHLHCSIPVLAQTMLSLNSLKSIKPESLGRDVNLHVLPNDMLIKVSERIIVLLQGNAEATRALFDLLHTVQATSMYMDALNSAARNSFNIANRDENVKEMLQAWEGALTCITTIIAAITGRYPESRELLKGFFDSELRGKGGESSVRSSVVSTKGGQGVAKEVHQ